MRKIFVISMSIMLLAAALIESGVIDALLVFFLTGSLPGTSIALSPTAMMAIMAATAWLVLTRMTALGTINIFTIRRLVKRYARKNERMPKRRYSRI